MQGSCHPGGAANCCVCCLGGGCIAVQAVTVAALSCCACNFHIVILLCGSKIVAGHTGHSVVLVSEIDSGQEPGGWSGL